MNGFASFTIGMLKAGMQALKNIDDFEEKSHFTIYLDTHLRGKDD
jgi:hypothetical protein